MYSGLLIKWQNNLVQLRIITVIILDHESIVTFEPQIDSRHLIFRKNIGNVWILHLTIRTPLSLSTINDTSLYNLFQKHVKDGCMCAQ